MKKIDQSYHCQITGQAFGVWNLQCYLRIFQPHSEVQTVIIFDIGFEIGWFIPYTIIFEWHKGKATNPKWIEILHDRSSDTNQGLSAIAIKAT